MFYQTRVNSSTENLEKLRKFAYQAARENGISDEEAIKLEMAVDEACSNVIRHAYHDKTDGEIIVEMEFSENKVEIRVRDRGTGFDFESIKPVDIKEYIREEKIGGLGIHLMKLLMDEVHYKQDENNYNELRMIKHLK